MAKTKASKTKPSRKPRKKAPATHPEVTLPAYDADQLNVEYVVATPEPWTHNIEIQVDIRGFSQGSVDVALPTWTPGSYKVREFARNVSRFDVVDGDGKALKWSMLDKQTWRIEAPKADLISIRYRVYGFEQSVRTPHVDDTHAFFQPTNALIYVVDQLDAPAMLRLLPFEGWKVACPLPKLKGEEHCYFAENYDILADAPVEMGTHEVYSFEVDGKLHEIAIYGWGNHDPEQMVKDFTKIVRQQKKFWGGLPYENYLFILHFLPGLRGGLEHLNSQVSDWDSLELADREKYEDFLSLISHEFFHTWNVKRHRPEILGPFDYSCEQYTPDLWIMEGLTVYYEWIQMVRSGVVSVERFLKAWTTDLRRWDRRPGNEIMSAGESSFLAWTKLYLADENFVNSGVSYYLQGMLVAVCLDVEIRKRTDNAKSLDDVMKLSCKRYGWPKPGFAQGGFEEVVAEVAGGKWDAWFRKHVYTAGNPDFSALKRAFSYYGLKLERVAAKETLPSGKVVTPKKENWIGWELAEKKGDVSVQIVRDDSPASRAGLSAKDELLAISDIRIRSRAQVDTMLKMFEPGDMVQVVVFRGDFLHSCDLEIGEIAAGKLVLSADLKAGEAQRSALSALTGQALVQG